MKNYMSIALILVLTGCVIEIGESGYRTLPDAKKAKIKSFNEAVHYNPDASWEDFFIYEINSENMRSLLKQQEYTWFHIWIPYCKAEHCITIKPYENLESDYADKGLNLTFISSTRIMHWNFVMRVKNAIKSVVLLISA